MQIPAEVRLLIMRGVPGSGKSTLARSLANQDPRWRVIEADRHFYVNGRYTFQVDRVSDAHANCQRECFDALAGGQSVIVANTHARLWEFAPYVGQAQVLGVEFRIVECDGSWPNVHDVPDAVVTAMRDKFEPLPASLTKYLIDCA